LRFEVGIPWTKPYIQTGQFFQGRKEMVAQIVRVIFASDKDRMDINHIIPDNNVVTQHMMSQGLGEI
jgi:hypothetical protein